ncbi:unnamed protein product [Darwinula stevensoni]|uniref:Uncharacterized protein n=1 Tax=Darwinula stevensoni TaxID=69355 RepID=A0A7R9A5K4_9CRUS|nr:unnamed protein product [Darwinula stevensoni]CAG0892267.1 unnamed protein product [Darwinula stevensoni]
MNARAFHPRSEKASEPLTMAHRDALKKLSKARAGSVCLEMDAVGLSRIQPQHLEGLDHLQELYLTENSLTEIPEALASKLPNLTHLDARRNKLRRLPESLGDLSELRFLLLDDNELQDIPDSLDEANHWVNPRKPMKVSAADGSSSICTRARSRLLPSALHRMRDDPRQLGSLARTGGCRQPCGAVGSQEDGCLLSRNRYSLPNEDELHTRHLLDLEVKRRRMICDEINKRLQKLKYVPGRKHEGESESNRTSATVT